MVPQILIDKVTEAQFFGVPDWAVADALNAVDVTFSAVKTDVSTNDAKEILLANGDWPKITIAAEDVATPSALRGACIVLRDTILHTTLVRASQASIDTQIVAVLGGLLAVNIISQASYDALLALTNRHVSWAEHNNLYPVTARDVGLARGGI